MKTQLSLSELAAKIEADQGAKEDCVADSSIIDMRREDSGDLEMHIGGSIQRSFGILDNAHRQIGGRLAIPAKYYDRMKNDAPDLLANNVNHWLHDAPKPRLVRTMRGQMRALLSDRYRAVEHEQMLEVILPILNEIPDIRFESLAVTETRMFIKAVTPKIETEVQVGDRVQAGIVISNSEVGMGAVNIQPLVYRLVCLNGMIVNDARFRATHVGSSLSGKDAGIAHMLSDEAIEADSKAVLLKVRDVLKATVSQEFIEGEAAKMREAAAGEKIEGDVPKAVETLAKMVNLTNSEQSGVLRHLIDGADRSRYGLLNAVTRFSQDVESYDRATELEAIGGQILELPKGSWRQIAQAA